jgi:hypothetical protein
MSKLSFNDLKSNLYQRGSFYFYHVKLLNVATSLTVQNKLRK